MRSLRRKFVCLALLCGMLPAWFLACNKAALNLQRGFWQGLGFNISELITGINQNQ